MTQIMSLVWISGYIKKCNFQPLSIGLRKRKRVARKSVKELGHAILGNFSIDPVVIELTEITQ